MSKPSNTIHASARTKRNQLKRNEIDINRIARAAHPSLALGTLVEETESSELKHDLSLDR